MSWYISYLRAKADGNNEKANTEQKGMHRTLHPSNTFLNFSEIVFGTRKIDLNNDTNQVIDESEKLQKNKRNSSI